MLVGRAKSFDAIAYFKANKKSKNIVTGWITVSESEDDSLQASQSLRLKQQLSSESKFGVIKPTADNNISLYIFPI